MIRLLQKISTFIIIAIGVIHTSMTPVFYDHLSEAAFWFAGTGLAAIFIGLLNISLWRGGAKDPVVRRTGNFANFLFLAFMIIGMIIMPGL